MLKNVSKTVELAGKKYEMFCNINVLQELQDRYGSMQAWADHLDDAKGEASLKAVLDGLAVMINEGIDIANDDGKNRQMITRKQLGRMVDEVSLPELLSTMGELISESMQSAEKKG